MCWLPNGFVLYVLNVLNFTSCAAICIYIIYACVETTDACKIHEG